jgi:predicted RNase H-like HicB family nuclease
VRRAGYVVFTFRFEKEDGRWTAYCDELGTATFGRSLPEAERKLSEAVLLHLSTLEEVGERERFFKEHDIEFHPKKPKDDILVRLPVNGNSYIHPHIQPIPAGVA